MAALLLWSSAVKAQNPTDYYEETPHTFLGGLIAGANFTQVDGDNYAGYRRVGLNAGGVVYTRLSEHFAVSLEILFSQKGSVSDGAQISTKQNFLIEKYGIGLGYAEVPIQLCIFDKHKSHISAGFSVSRLAYSSESATILPTGGTATESFDFSPYPFRKMDYNVIAGGSLHLVKGLFLNLRFQYSLRPIRGKDDNPPEFSAGRPQYNNMWTLRVMYLFM